MNSMIEDSSADPESKKITRYLKSVNPSQN